MERTVLARHVMSDLGTAVLLALFLTICVAGTAKAHSWKSPEGVSAVENPLPVSAETTARGSALYREFCAACHGDGARGGGKAQEKGEWCRRILFGGWLPILRGDFFWKVTHGRGDMPGFGKDLSSEEIWAVLRFLESLTP